MLGNIHRTYQFLHFVSLFLLFFKSVKMSGYVFTKNIAGYSKYIT